MKKIPIAIALLIAAVVFSPLVASAQSTYTTLNGTVNLVAGLTNLTSVTAINTPNQAVGISYITDGSWSTGIANLGGLVGSPVPQPNNGTLAGDFGGGTIFAGSSSIILIGVDTSAWGDWTIRLLLQNDGYSSAINFSDADLISNPSVLTDVTSDFFENGSGSTMSPGAMPTSYLELDLAAFDILNIGVKGIEMSSMQWPFLDITYIGVTGVGPGPGPDPAAVPEPGQVAASLLLLAGIGGYVFFKRRKAAKATMAAV